MQKKNKDKRTKYQKRDFNSPEWKSLDLNGKIKVWLEECDGKFPTYNKLILNLIKSVDHSFEGSDDGYHEIADGGHHKIAFNTPAVIYDRELDTYRPDYEYETIMFQNMLGKLRDAGFISLDASAEILGTGSATDRSNYDHGLSNSGHWRPYITLTVSFESMDIQNLLDAINSSREDICDNIVANIVNKLL